MRAAIRTSSRRYSGRLGGGLSSQDANPMAAAGIGNAGGATAGNAARPPGARRDRASTTSGGLATRGRVRRIGGCVERDRRRRRRDVRGRIARRHRFDRRRDPMRNARRRRSNASRGRGSERQGCGKPAGQTACHVRPKNTMTLGRIYDLYVRTPTIRCVLIGPFFVAHGCDGSIRTTSKRSRKPTRIIVAVRVAELAA